MLSLYKTLIRPIADYAAVVYGPMLTKDQGERLERQQRQVLKVTFGHQVPYREIIEKYDICKLSERRGQLLDQFIISTMKNEKYRDRWLPIRNTGARVLRSERPFKEKHARTERLKKSPLYTIRRRANELFAQGIITLNT